MARSRTPRVLRAMAAASVATFVALLSHLAGGGVLPGVLGVLVPWVLAVMVCTILAGSRLSMLRLVLAVSLSQFLFHTLFVVGLVDSGNPTVVGQHHVHDLSSLAAAPSSGIVHVDALMWVWHGVAAIGTTAMLHRGESAIRALLALADEIVASIRRLIVSMVSCAPAPRTLPRHPATPRVEVGSLGFFPDTVARRGPPVLSVV